MQFSRTVPPFTRLGPALAALMTHYNWTECVILTSTTSAYLDTGPILEKQLQEKEFDVLKPPAFDAGNFRAETLTEIRSALVSAHLYTHVCAAIACRTSGKRIVVLGAVAADRNSVASSARDQGMNGPGPGYAWISMWEEEQSGASQLREGWLYAIPFEPSKDKQAFRQQVSDMSKSKFDITIDPESVDLAFSAALYDAILLYAHAATEVMSKEGNLTDGKAVASVIQRTRFEGAGGQYVALDDNGDRITSYEIKNFQLETEKVNSQRRKTNQLSRVRVGLYFDFSTIVCRDRMGTSK